MRIYWIIATLVLILAVPVSAQQADWVGPLQVSTTWDYKATDFCSRNTQCLVKTGKCIDSATWDLDHYCDSGQWTSRTKDIALQLLELALGNNPSNFSLYCNNYDAVLNKYDYSTDYGSVTTFLRSFCTQPSGKTKNCVNNVCAVKYGSNVAFGMSLNADISGDKSILKALNLSNTICDNAKNNNGVYNSCGSNVWYNHDKESIIHAKANSLPAPSTTTKAFFISSYDKIQTYAYANVHNPNVRHLNYTSFKLRPMFDTLYLSKHNFNYVYSYKQTNITLFQDGYIGLHLSNIDLPENACNDIFKQYDSRAGCEKQPTQNEFFVTAKRITSKSLVDAWDDLLKIRVGP